MLKARNKIGYAVLLVALVAGCPFRSGDVDRGDAPLVAARAILVADLIGGTGGFGGSPLTGYLDHAPAHMGFDVESDLADADAVMTVVLDNDSAQEAVFLVSYFAHHVSFDDRSVEVTVAARSEELLEIPCPEIVGMGALDGPGEVGVRLADGTEVANTFAVPIFLGLDFTCGSARTFSLTADVDDLDADGDVAELILTSDGLTHAESGGPSGHSHKDGMMGPHRMGGMVFSAFGEE